MLLIERKHPSVLNVVHRMLCGQNTVPTTTVDDFDHCELRIKVTLDETSTPTESGVPEFVVEEPSSATDGDAPPPKPKNALSLLMPGDILIRLKHTVPNSILDKFGNFSEVVSPLFPSGYFSFDAAKKGVSINIPKDVTPKVRDDTLNLASELRIMALYPIFVHQAESFLKKPELVTPLRIPYRPTESMYMFTNKKGDFYVVVSLVIENKDDQLLVRNFLQSFMDIKRSDRSIASAPGFFFDHRKAPQDLPANLIAEEEAESTFWVSFQLSKLQLEKRDRTFETARQLVNFRNNLMYHIHCCRSYMHAGMRKRVVGAVQILNRAKTSTTGKAKVEIK